MAAGCVMSQMKWPVLMGTTPEEKKSQLMCRPGLHFYSFAFEIPGFFLKVIQPVAYGQG